MRNYLLIVLLTVAAATAPAVVVDDFEDGQMDEYTQTVVLDLGGEPGGLTFGAGDGQVWASIETYDGIEQGLCLRDDVSLDVGDVLLIDTTGFVDGSQDIGLAVAASKNHTPGVRRDYISLYMRSATQVYSRGFDGTAEFDLAGGGTGGPAVEALFIERLDTHTFAAGWISGATSQVVAVRTVDNAAIGTAIGFYADMRDDGFIGGFDNLELLALPAPPMIVSHPAGQMLNEHETVRFETVFSSPSTPVVTWYKAASPADIALDSGQAGIDVRLTWDSQAEEYTSTLELSGLSTGDCGSYYCRVSNDTGAVSSEPAELVVCGLVAHWTLDQDRYAEGFYLEETGGHDAAVGGTAVFEAGADGRANGAVQIGADGGWAVCPMLDPVRKSGQMSISFWARHDAAPGSQTDLLAHSTTGEILLMPNGLQAGRWQHICTVFDGAVGRLYVDGVLRDESAWHLPLATQAVIHLGISGSGQNAFNGAMDDVRLYNYALTDTDAADLRFAFSGDRSCLPALASVYDISGPDGKSDCVVDVWDLAMLAGEFLQSGSPYDLTGPAGVPDGTVDLNEYAALGAEWLACGLYPLCE